MKNLLLRSFRLIVPVILVLNLVSRLVIVSKPLESIDGLLLPDDTYISLNLARNIASGKGPMSGQAFTNGFQPLYVFMTVPFFWITSDSHIPVYLALVMLSIADTVCLMILLRLIQFLTSNKVLVILASFLWIINDHVIESSLNGLETIIASLFLLLGSFYYLKHVRATIAQAKAYFILGLIFGFAIISRIDSLILGFVIGLLILFQFGNRWGARIQNSSIYLLGILIPTSVVCLYWHHYTGSIFPVSGKAVRLISMAYAEIDRIPTLENMYIPNLLRGFRSIVKENLILSLLSIFFFVFLLARKKLSFKSLTSILPFFAYGLALYLAYTLYIFGGWFYYRYFFPITILMMVIFILMVKRAISPNSQIAVVSMVASIWVLSQVVFSDLVSYYMDNPKGKGYMSIGEYARDNFEDGTVIGSCQSGAIEYFASNLTVINLDGVVNEECYQHIKSYRHIDYIQGKSISYVIGWGLDYHFIGLNSRSEVGPVLKKIKKVENITSWEYDWNIYQVIR